jgi:hypothetical protein
MKFFSVLIILTTLLISYQNCSVYESEGRALLNDNGVVVNNGEQAKVRADLTCDQYFNDNFLREVFREELFETVFHINAKKEVSCTIKTLERDFECKFSFEYADWLHDPPSSHQVIPDSVRLSMHYEQIALKDSVKNEVIYIVKKGVPEAVGCKTNLDDNTFIQDLSLLATLAQSMLEQSVQTRP